MAANQRLRRAIIHENGDRPDLRGVRNAHNTRRPLCYFHGRVEFSPAQKHLEAAIAKRTKELETTFAKRVATAARADAKAYFDKNFPEFQKNNNDAAAAEAYWRERNNNFKPIFSAEEYKNILMCLHPDGKRSSEKIIAAFVAFKAKELQLTGKRR